VRGARLDVRVWSAGNSPLGACPKAFLSAWTRCARAAAPHPRGRIGVLDQRPLGLATRLGPVRGRTLRPFLVWSVPSEDAISQR
jgi:hypothetical protein